MAASADNYKRVVLHNRDVDAEDNAVVEVHGDLLELRLELCDKLWLASKMQLVAGLALAGATTQHRASTSTHIQTYNR